MAAAGKPKALDGGEAALSLRGHTLTGRIDGEVFFELYRKDGTTGLLEGKEVSAGKWTIEGDKLCTKYKGEDKECFGIAREGEVVTLTGPKGKTWRLKLLEGNPKNL
jgi:hypothetical protein